MAAAASNPPIFAGLAVTSTINPAKSRKTEAAHWASGGGPPYRMCELTPPTHSVTYAPASAVRMTLPFQRERVSIQFISLDQLAGDLCREQNGRGPPARMRAAADVIEALVAGILVRWAQESMPPAVRMRAVDRTARHRVTVGNAARRPNVAHHDVRLDLGESAATQSREDAPPRLGDPFFIPFIFIIVGRGVGHDKERFTFVRRE